MSYLYGACAGVNTVSAAINASVGNFGTAVICGLLALYMGALTIRQVAKTDP